MSDLQILREDLERARVNRNTLACIMDDMCVLQFEGDGRCQAQLDEYDAEIRSLEAKIAATVKEEARKNAESDALGCPFAAPVLCSPVIAAEMKLAGVT